MRPDADRCPRDVKESFKRYVEDGVPTGDFLRAVLSNSLTEAFGRADEDNCELMPHIVAYVYHNIPTTMCGSPKAYKSHISRKMKEREG